IIAMSELKVTPMKPRAHPDEEAGHAGEAREEAGPEQPSSLREEHDQRKRAQQEQIEETDRDTLHRMLYQMILIRRFEEKAAEAYTLGKIGGFCHLYIGQEAVAVGSIAALNPDDYVMT